MPQAQYTLQLPSRITTYWHFPTVSHGDSGVHILPHHEQLQPAPVDHQKPPEVLSGS